MKSIIYISLIIFSCSCDQLSVKEKDFTNKIMPSFNMLLMDSTSYLNTDNIPVGQPIVFLLISTECSYCQSMTTEIIKEIDLLKDIRFYIISPYPFKQIKKYFDNHELKKYSNITMAQDYTLFFTKYINAKSV